MTRRRPRARESNVPSAGRSEDGVSGESGDEGNHRAEGYDPTRRRFLRGIGASALVGTIGIGSTQVAAQTDPESFVETDGTQFVVDGEPIYFHGANNFWITDAYRGTEDRIDALFEQFEEMGINFLRTFVTCEGGDGDCYILEPYEHSEGAFETLDYIVARAADHGIRLTLILADNWDHNGGIPQYVEWIDSADHHGDFYVDENARELYRWHVEEVLTRENTITGREYREEPSIAMWELCNEPRLEGDAFGEGEDPGYEERASILEDWIEEMSGFIKEFDANHLVSTGMEGFYTREDRTEWFYNEWTGQDFVRHHSIDTIDACSFHMYPYHWNFPLEYGATWVREHVEDAHEEVGKPGYCGEFNVNRESGLEARNRYLEEWYETLDATDADAAMIWQIVLAETHDHDGFQVYRSETGDVLAEYAQATSAKSVAGSGAELAAPTSVVATTTGSSIAVDWSRVSGVAEYIVSLDGAVERTTSETSVVLEGLEADLEYEVGVTAVGTSGEETATATTTATTEGPETVGYPEWEYGTVYEEGDRVVWNEIVWEAQWYTDDEEPRFENGYAWEFVRVIGVAGIDSDSDSDSDSGSEDGDPDEPTAPADVWIDAVGESTLEVGWETVVEADSYRVYLDGELEAETTETETSITGLASGTSYEVGVRAVANGEESTLETTDASTETDGDGGSAEPPAIDGTQPVDTTGDGLSNDFTGSGSTTTTDVTVFFEHVDDPVVAEYPQYYDFTGNGQVTVTDVVELFESL
ncbi:fibronectin type III domain-containing protein [Natronoglomus mannanivorans]|uniref:mannan endo-1,4-beta-mannosidase n=1 Tax=Natronoglomus mannanivorans TaxID=2979990 RepID=A0AAP3E0R3_9EURY|nr:cellulase family glycosylhydrolase [Halobacteria archaeon AArc-xg1-1]